MTSGTTMLEFQPQHSDLGVPTSEYRFRNSDFGMSIPAFQFWNSDLNFNFCLQILASKFRSSNSAIPTFETRHQNPDLRSPISELHFGIQISEIWFGNSSFGIPNSELPFRNSIFWIRTSEYWFWKPHFSIRILDSLSQKTKSVPDGLIWYLIEIHAA